MHDDLGSETQDVCCISRSHFQSEVAVVEKQSELCSVHTMSVCLLIVKIFFFFVPPVTEVDEAGRMCNLGLD